MVFLQKIDIVTAILENIDMDNPEYVNIKKVIFKNIDIDIDILENIGDFLLKVSNFSAEL